MTTLTIAEPVAPASAPAPAAAPHDKGLRSGAIRGLRTWVTSEYEHDGLRVSSGAVLDRLIRMGRGLA